MCEAGEELMGAFDAGLLRGDASNRRTDGVACCCGVRLRLMVIVEGLMRADSSVLGRGGW